MQNMTCWQLRCLASYKVKIHLTQGLLATNLRNDTVEQMTFIDLRRSGEHDTPRVYKCVSWHP